MNLNRRSFLQWMGLTTAAAAVSQLPALAAEPVIPKSGLATIPIHMIHCRRNIRAEADPDYLRNLARHIREQGMFHPITVMCIQPKRYECMDGLMRLEVYKQLGRTEIECYIAEIEVEDKIVIPAKKPKILVPKLELGQPVKLEIPSQRIAFSPPSPNWYSAYQMKHRGPIPNPIIR